MLIKAAGKKRAGKKRELSTFQDHLNQVEVAASEGLGSNFGQLAGHLLWSIFFLSTVRSSKSFTRIFVSKLMGNKLHQSTHCSTK